MVIRRALLGFLVMGGAPARAVLSVGPSDSLRQDAILWLPSGAAFSCPARRARLLGVMRLKAMEVSAVGFAADAGNCVQDLLALVGPDGRLLALERLHWKAAGGDELTTRFAMLPDRVHITLERSAALHRTGWVRESWTDFLKPVAGGLADAPPRAVLAGTLQAGVSRQRLAVAADLKPLRALTPAGCASFGGTPFA